MSAGQSRSIRHSERGMTLLEVLVATSLLSIVIVVLFQLFASGMRSLFTSGDYLRAVLKGEEKMRLLLDDPELREGSWSEVSPEGYTMSITVEQIEKEKTAALSMGLLQVELVISWRAGRKDRSFSLSTLKETGGAGRGAREPLWPLSAAR